MDCKWFVMNRIAKYFWVIHRFTFKHKPRCMSVICPLVSWSFCCRSEFFFFFPHIVSLCLCAAVRNTTWMVSRVREQEQTRLPPAAVLLPPPPPPRLWLVPLTVGRMLSLPLLLPLVVVLMNRLKVGTALKPWDGWSVLIIVHNHAYRAH